MAEGIVLSSEQLDDLLTAAAEKGAKRALASVGLDDKHAAQDVQDLREVMKSWRAVKNTILHSILIGIGRLATLLVVAVLAAYAGKHGVRLPFLDAEQ